MGTKIEDKQQLLGRKPNSVVRTRVVKEVPSLVSSDTEKLRAVFPHAFSEGRLDFEKLRVALGDIVDGKPERFTFSWAGKRNAIQILQMPTRATLVPVEDESVHFDNTGNMFIEGDNLEVLKLLYKPYFGRVKMIYIDPPYNTGSDFIYPDNFADPLDTYLKITGQRDSGGNLLVTNPETSGRFHSAWLSMMYPRLFLCRQLLRDDGVIFVTIDDNEAPNLRLMMNEIFGEENFIAQVVWQKKVSPSNDAQWFSSDHDYVLVYAKSKQIWRPKRLKRTEEQKQYYKNPDNDLRGPWNSATYTCNKSKDERPNLYYPITNPNTREEILPRETAVWAYSREQYKEHVRQNLIYWGKDGKSQTPRFKLFLAEAGDIVPRSVWHYSEVGHTQEATGEFQEIMPEGGFLTPKPTRLIRRMLELATDPKNHEPQIVLDFFAGSCTTAQAILEMNREDGGDRRFIMVQLPEPLDLSSRAAKAGMKNLADVGKERIRRIILRLKKDKQTHLEAAKQQKKTEDLGFRAFKLAESNFKSWKGVEEKTSEKYAEEMKAHIDPLVERWTRLNVTYEVAIKEGLGLDIATERVKRYADNEVWSVEDKEKGQRFLICLDERIRPSTIKDLEIEKNETFVCRDVAINDTSAANLALQCRLKTI